MSIFNMSLIGVTICIGWMFSLCLHEFSHALAAYLGGDNLVKNKGNLIFNPFKRYPSSNYNIVFPLIFLLMCGIWLPGGAIYINKHKLRNRWWQSAVSAAGPITNICLALLLYVIFQATATTNISINTQVNENAVLQTSLAGLIYLQIFTAIFNLLPVPGLDGYEIIDPWISENIRSQFKYIKRNSTLVIIGLAWWSIFMFGIIVSMISKALNIPDAFINSGFLSFQQSIYLVFCFIFFMLCANSWSGYYQRNIAGNNNDLGKKKATNQSCSESHKNTTEESKCSANKNKKADFTNQVHPETRKRAIAFAGYDKGRIERLLNNARFNNPDRSEQWYWEKILYDMERDRGF